MKRSNSQAPKTNNKPTPSLVIKGLQKNPVKIKQNSLEFGKTPMANNSKLKISNLNTKVDVKYSVNTTKNSDFNNLKKDLNIFSKPIMIAAKQLQPIRQASKDKNIPKPQPKQNAFKKPTKLPKPSDKYTKVKSSDPFELGKKHKTNFGYVYSAGGIPCRIQHGSVRLNLKWDIDPDSKNNI